MKVTNRGNKLDCLLFYDNNLVVRIFQCIRYPEYHIRNPVRKEWVMNKAMLTEASLVDFLECSRGTNVKN